MSSPSSPEYWHLGVHVCNEHETNLTLAVADVQKVLDDHNVPFDSHCIQDGLFWLGESDGVELPTEVVSTIEALHTNGKKFVATVVPNPIEDSEGYRMAEEMKLLLLRNDRTYVGQAFTRNIAYIDYTADGGENSVTKWLEFVLRTLESVSPDGIFVQGAWMIDETVATKIPEQEDDETFPYVPEFMDTAMHKLPPWNISSAQQPDDLFLLKHNTYASYLMNHLCASSVATAKFCLSSSPLHTFNYPSFLAKTSSSWFNFAKQIHQAVTSSIAGLKWFGFPVCGSDEFQARQEELCIRWYQFSSLMPVFKVTAARFVHHFSKHGQKLLIDAIER